jgi:hypothetical protein
MSFNQADQKASIRLLHLHLHLGPYPAPRPPTVCGAFYIFTIIKIATRSIVILVMSLTYLPSLKFVRLLFATIAYLARHGDLTWWRTVSRAVRNDLPTPGYLLKGRKRTGQSLARPFSRAGIRRRRPTRSSSPARLLPPRLLPSGRP